MKKKISVLLVLTVCLVTAFCFVGCSLFGGNAGSKSGTAKLEGVSDAKIAEMDAYITDYLDELVLSYAQEEGNVTNQSKVLKSALGTNTEFNFLTDKRRSIKPSINVTYDAATSEYTFKYTWNKTFVKSYTKKAQTVTYNGWAGQYSHTSDYEVLENEGDVAGVLDIISNALCTTINKTYSGAKTKCFSATAEIGVDAMGFTGSIAIKGNVDLDDADNTEIALELLNESKDVVFGLYYQGAEVREDAKLTVSFEKDDEMKYYYINYFALNQWINSSIKANVSTAAAWAAPENDGFAGLLSIFSKGAADWASTIASVVDMLADGYTNENLDGSTTYTIDFNLGSLVKQASDLLGDLLSGEDEGEGGGEGGLFEGIPVLEELDIATMHGLLGHLTISTVVADDEATDFEIAVNIPECTFYFNEDEEDGPKYDVPALNFALFVNDYTFTTDSTINDVIPDGAEDAQYFSPTNIKASGDVEINYVKDGETKLNSTFSYTVVTNINPLNAKEASLSVVIDQTQAVSGNTSNFLTVIVKNGLNKIWLGGSAITDALKLESGKILKIVCTEGIKELLGVDAVSKTFNGVTINKDGKVEFDPLIATEAIQKLLNTELGNYIVGYYYDKIGAQPKTSAADAEIDFASIGDIATSFMDFYDSIKDKSLVIDTENDSFSLDLAEEDITALSDIVSSVVEMFGLSYTLSDHLTVVKLFANCEGYESKIYANVKYDAYTAEFNCDWSEEGKVAMDFEFVLASGRTYRAEFVVETDAEVESSTKWTAEFKLYITSAYSFDMGDVLSLSVKLSDFHFVWGKANDQFVADAPSGTNVVDSSESIFDSLLDKLIPWICDEDAKLYEKVSFIDYEMIQDIAEFIVRQVA